MPSTETLLSQSAIWLFGRALDDLVFNPNAYGFPTTQTDADTNDSPIRVSQNDFLLRQLRGPETRLARILGFSFESQYFDMIRPAIFLVHGDGLDPERSNVGLRKNQDSRMPQETGRTGLAVQGGSFAAGIKVWAYDRADFTIRLDMDTGTLDSILLDRELNAMGAASQSAGPMVRSAGSMVQSAGSMVRSAGSMVRRGRSGGTNSE
jgi:hypothetical protein